MYINSIMQILPNQTYKDRMLHAVLYYILSFNITYLQFNNRNPLNSALNAIKVIIYQKYIDSLQTSTEYSDEYYTAYTNNMKTFNKMKQYVKFINTTRNTQHAQHTQHTPYNYLLSKLLQQIPSHSSLDLHRKSTTCQYIATYQY